MIDQINARTRLKMRDLNVAALNRWDPDDLRCATVEEMGELTKVLMKANLRKKHRIANVREEVADVLIMLDKMAKIYFKDGADLSRVVSLKLRKLQKKLERAG